MDFVGAGLMMSLIVSYILALQYGGQTHPWNSSLVIGLLIGFVAIVVTFIAWEIFQKERAMIVKRLECYGSIRNETFRQRADLKFPRSF